MVNAIEKMDQQLKMLGAIDAGLVSKKNGLSMVNAIEKMGLQLNGLMVIKHGLSIINAID